MELETRLRDKESEVEQLRRALAKAGIKQEEVPIHFDGVGIPPHSPSQPCLHWAPLTQSGSHPPRPQTSSEHA